MNASLLFAGTLLQLYIVPQLGQMWMSSCTPCFPVVGNWLQCAHNLCVYVFVILYFCLQI